MQCDEICNQITKDNHVITMNDCDAENDENKDSQGGKVYKIHECNRVCKHKNRTQTDGEFKMR